MATAMWRASLWCRTKVVEIYCHPFFFFSFFFFFLKKKLRELHYVKRFLKLFYYKNECLLSLCRLGGGLKFMVTYYHLPPLEVPLMRLHFHSQRDHSCYSSHFLKAKLYQIFLTSRLILTNELFDEVKRVNKEMVYMCLFMWFCSCNWCCLGETLYIESVKEEEQIISPAPFPLIDKVAFECWIGSLMIA